MIVGSLLLGILALPLAAKAEPVKLRLQEFLGQSWQQELISIQLDGDQPALQTGPIEVASDNQVLPAQLVLVDPWTEMPADVSSRADGAQAKDEASSKRVMFITDLAPGANKVFHVRLREENEPAKTDLTVSQREQSVELSTSKYGMRLLTGSATYAEPREPAEVPGPIIQLRTADGRWFGKSSMFGDKKITGYDAKLLAQGPVLARYRIEYRYSDDSSITLMIALAAGDTQARWRMRVQRTEASNTQTKSDDDDSGHETTAPVTLTGGWRLYLSPGIDALRMPTEPEYGDNRWGKHGEQGVVANLSNEPAGNLVTLVPWRDWWDQTTKASIQFIDGDAKPVANIAATQPGWWIVPAPTGTWVSNSDPRNQQQYVWLKKNLDDQIFFEFTDSPGWRGGTLGNGTPALRYIIQNKRGLNKPKANKKEEAELAEPLRGLGHQLATILDYTLDWKSQGERHPKLFASHEQMVEYRKTHEYDPELIAELKERSRVYQPIDSPTYRDRPPFALYLMTGDDALAKQYGIVDRLRSHLNLLGGFDLMRGAAQVASEFDAIIDSDLVTPSDRKLFRSQMAFLGYTMASPVTWSMERGFASGNLNMSVAYVLNLGLVAAVIPDHPMAKQWSDYALTMLDQWLDMKVGPNGEFRGAGESLGNYSQTSAAMLLAYSVAARNAGFTDYVDDPRMKKLMLFLAKEMTPPNPGLSNLTGTVPAGRGPSQQRPGLPGLMARATMTSDPEYSRIMQWVWARTGYSHRWIDDRLGGLGYVYMDPKLPAQTPDWGMDVFTERGVIMRQGLGTPNEYYLNFLVEPQPETIFQSANASFPGIWAKGVPVISAFRGHGYAEREMILNSRVLPARPVDVDNAANRSEYARMLGDTQLVDWSSSSRLDYAQASVQDMDYRTRKLGEPWMTLPVWPKIDKTTKLPIEWSRRVLMVKGHDATDSNYFIVRDHIESDQPTVWQMWSVSEGLGEPQQVADEGANFAKAHGGNELRDARPLEGDRFIALGQFGVDLDYFVALPRDTPRQTARAGLSYHIPEQHQQYQDLLHLQREGSGDYFVAMFPRDHGQASPEFQRLAEDKMLKITGAFGTDYVLLTNDSASATATDTLAIEGSVAVVQDRNNVTALSLGAPGRIIYQSLGIQSDRPVTLVIGDKSGSIDLAKIAEQSPSFTLQVQLPEGWTVADQHGVSVKSTKQNWQSLTFKDGQTSAELLKEAQ